MRPVRLPWPVLAVALLSLGGCRSHSFDPPPPPNTKGFWFATVPGDHVITGPEREFVWTFDNQGLYRVELSGASQAVAGLPPVASVEGVVASGQQAWAVVGTLGKQALYLISPARGGGGKPMAQELLGKADSIKLYPGAADPPTAWARVATGPTERRLYQLEGESGSLERKVEFEGIHEVYPAADGRQAWVIATRAVESDQQEKHLYHVRVQASGAPLVRCLSRADARLVQVANPKVADPNVGPLAIESVQLADSGTAVWVRPLDTKGVFFVAGGELAEPAPRLLGDRLFDERNLAYDAGGLRVWACPRDRGELHLLVVKNNKAQAQQVLRGESIASRDLQASSTTGPSAWLWVRTTAGKLLFIPPGAAEPVARTGTLPPDAEFILVSAGREHAWVWSSKPPGLFLVDRNGQTQRYRSPVGTARVLSLERLGDSNVAWARTEAPGGVHRVNTALEVVSVKNLDDRKVRALTLPPSPDQPVGVRLRAYQLFFVGPDGKLLHDEPLNTGPIQQIRPGARSRHGWLETGDENHVFGTADELSSLRVQFDDQVLESARAAPEELRAAPWRSGFVAQVVLGWPAGASLNAAVALTVYDAKGNKVAAGTSESTALEGRTEAVQVPLTWSGPREVWRQPHRVELRVSSSNGSDLRVSWDGVRFTQPRLTRRFWMTFAACLVLVSLLAALGWLIVASRSTTGWVVLLLSLLGTLGSGFLTRFLDELERHDIDTRWLIGVLVGAFLIFLVVGIIRLALFRVLVRIFPFNVLAPLVLRLGRIRRGMFRDYAARLQRETDRARQGPPLERYCPLPATVEEPASPLAGPAPADRAELILRYLTDPQIDRRAHVYIESVGGHGKTALIREVVSRAVRRFLGSGPCPPLPVLLSAAPGEIGKVRLDRWLEQKIDDALGADSFPTEVLQAQLRFGDFFVVLDGLPEMGIDPGALRNFLVGEYGERVRLLLAGRPSEGYADALASADRVVIVKPEPLSPDQRDAFVAHYGGQPLRPALAALCARDAQSSPLLVRLAMLEEVQTPFELFQRAVPWLLRSPDDPEAATVVRAAAQLCVETCWRSGGRAVDSAQVRAEQRGILKRLVASALLIDSPGVAASRRKEFYHVQALDWFTAQGLVMGLVQGSDDKPLPLGRLLTLAAGQHRFREGGRSLFQMCVAVLGEDLGPALREELNRWVALPSRDPLTVQQVVESIHPSVQDELRQRLANVTEVKVALVEAIRLSDENLDLQRHLFVALVPLLWPRVGD
jgi:hypothetical protein